MKKIQTDLEGVILIEPTVWKDDRGYFFESYQQARYSELGIECSFVQDNEAFSTANVIRGLHYQLPPFHQAKLVRVITGKVIDAVVDIRPNSPTYGKHQTFVLSAENKHQLFVPAGFAHGYLTISETAVFAYKCDQYYAADHEGGIRLDDPTLNIQWPKPFRDLIVSEKDLAMPTFSEHMKWPSE